jgi:DNA mismatch repair protein MutS2
MTKSPVSQDLRDPAVLPDLLQRVPLVRADLERLGEALAFAFASGGSDVPLYEVFDHSQLAFSTWEPEHFESDLYLEVFLQLHGRLQFGAQSSQVRIAPLLRILNHPPDDLGNVRFRQGVLRELADHSEYRQSFEQVYLALVRFRDLLSDSGLGERLDVNRRRVDILEAAQTVIDGLASGFEGAQSGLSRLRAFGQRVKAQPAYARVGRLLDFESGMASLEARLTVGYDGQLRHFEIVGISEATHNPFYATRLGRLWRKFWQFVRGYRFSDAEVLGRFVDEVFLGVAPELGKFFQLLGDMEFYLVALAFRDAAHGQGLETCLPEVRALPGPGEEAPRVWANLFNPLLLRPGDKAVPCSVAQMHCDDIVLLTGPNSGGKTRLLQALSLGQLLGQGGMFVPASHAELVVASAMFLSIGDHPTADQREGRLGSELLRIRKVFESVRPGAFVVVDELCSGTNPSEGEEIFRMVVSLLRELRPQAFISTHFLEFAAALAQDRSAEGIDFIRAELDLHDRPTYRFVPGVAPTSLARQTAARLGVTRNELMALTKAHRHAAEARVPARERGRPGEAQGAGEPAPRKPLRGA